jgi:hypothetical protein
LPDLISGIVKNFEGDTKMPRRILVLVISVLVTAVCSFGTTPELSFGIEAGGSYSYAGLGGNLTASGLLINSLTATNTPGGTDATPYTVIDGVLNFVSGAFTNTANGVWNFSGGAPGIIITGCIAGVTGTGAGGACTGVGDDTATLVSDQFNSAAIGVVDGSLEILAAGLNGNYLPSLASAFGVSTTFTAASEETDFVGGGIVGLTPGSGTAFSATSLGGAVGTMTSAAVPEDWTLSSSLGLFGFGMVAFAVARRFGFVKTATF